jgi:hypothetical protein
MSRLTTGVSAARFSKGSVNTNALDYWNNYLSANGHRVNIVSVWIPWSAVEVTRGTFIWASLLDQAFDDAEANDFSLIVRVAPGMRSPGHIFTTGGVPYVASTAVFNGLPIGTKAPLWWSSAYKTELTRMRESLRDYLDAGVAALGTPFKSLIAGIPMVPVTDSGAESSVGYCGNTKAGWDAATGLTESQRQALMSTAQLEGADNWIADFYDHNSMHIKVITAMGSMQGDGYAGADALIAAKYTGANLQKLVTLWTDFVPNIDGSNNVSGFWRARFAHQAAIQDTVLAAGGFIAFQSAGYDPGSPGSTPNNYGSFNDPVAAFHYAMITDLIPNWPDALFFEANSSELGVTANKNDLLDSVQPVLEQNEPTAVAAKFQVNMDGAGWVDVTATGSPKTGTKSYTSLTAALHTFQCRYVDAVGNISPITTWQWTVGGGAPPNVGGPSITWVAPSTTRFSDTNVKTVDLLITDSDGINATFHIFQDGVDKGTMTNAGGGHFTKSITFPTDTPTNLSVEVFDNHSSPLSTQSSRTFTYATPVVDEPPDPLPDPPPVKAAERGHFANHLYDEMAPIDIGGS